LLCYSYVGKNLNQKMKRIDLIKDLYLSFIESNNVGIMETLKYEIINHFMTLEKDKKISNEVDVFLNMQIKDYKKNNEIHSQGHFYTLINKL